MFIFTRPFLYWSIALKTPGEERSRQSLRQQHADRPQLWFQPTEHVLQTDDAGEVVVKVDVVVGVSKPEADQLQEPVVQLHAFTGTEQHVQCLHLNATSLTMAATYGTVGRPFPMNRFTCSFQSNAKLVGRHLPRTIRVEGQEEHL